MMAMIESLVEKDPKNTEIQHNLADSFSYYGAALEQAERWQEALDQLQKALEIDARLAAQSPENGEYAHSCGSYHLEMGRARMHLGQTSAAAADERAAQSFLEAAAAKDPSNMIPRRELVKVFVAQGEINEKDGQPETAHECFKRAQRQLETVIGKNSPSKDDTDDLNYLHRKLAEKTNEKLPGPSAP